MTAFSARIEALDRSTMLFRRSSISLSTHPGFDRWKASRTAFSIKGRRLSSDERVLIGLLTLCLAAYVAIQIASWGGALNKMNPRRGGRRGLREADLNRRSGQRTL